MVSDFILFSLFMLGLGTFSFGGIIVTSLVCEKHRHVKTELFDKSKLQYADGDNT